jgi:PAS domain S-box-containing protein
MANEAHNNAQSKSLFDKSVWEGADNLAAGVAEAIARALQCDEVHVDLTTETSPIDPHTKLRATFTLFRNQATPGFEHHLFTASATGLAYRDAPIAAPLTVNDVSRARLPGDLSAVLTTLGVKSFGAFLIRRGSTTIGVVSCFYRRSFHRWRSDEISAVGQLGEQLPIDASHRNWDSPQQAGIDPSIDRYQRLATQGNIIILTTDDSFRVVDVFGNSEELLGVSSEKLRGDPSIWSAIVDLRDSARLAKRITRLRTKRGELEEEVRISHQKTGHTRWILLRALPYFDEDGLLLGWEGFGVDVTERRVAQDSLLRQNTRMQALFEISRSLSELRDPAMVTLTGLRSVIGATNSDCGYAVFCSPDGKVPEVVAAVGLSEDYLASMDEVLEGPSLLRQALDSQTRFLIPDMQRDPRAALRLAQLERVHSAMIIPLTFEHLVYGAIVLFNRTPESYDSDDFDVAVSAASQITLAIRQAEMLEVQRRQSASLASLYTVSRELAKHRATVDFSEQIIPTLKHEFALKRCWIGLTNQQGNFVVGRAGFGPGVDEDVITAHIEATEEQPILREILEGRTPLVIDDLSTESPEALLSLFPEPRSLVIVPMITIGQVMGILVLEPLSQQTFSSAERLQLVVSMANEMATAMMAGRFESKMANAVKMRTAGLLASGVAHNFNNILQAILGQVSLVQLHAKGNSPVMHASTIIQDAAMRGAALTRQLLSFATRGASKKAPLEVAGFLEESHSLYESLLGKVSRLTLDNQMTEGTSVYADSSQLQQVITSMLANSRDALSGIDAGEIYISAHNVVVRASELAADLSPGAYVRIDIRDNGVGMTPEEQARCFEPFFTTKNVDRETGVGLSGSGLGLAAAYAVVKDHNGTITVHSKEGEGSIFSIYLPVHTPVAGSTEQRASIPSTHADGVLLLGVDPGVQPFIASALESLGFAALGVFDIRHAQELIAQERSHWGAIMIDKEGIASSHHAVCEDLGAAFAGLAVICLCSQSDTRKPLQNSEDATQRLFHIEKPVTGWAIEAVMQRVRELRSKDQVG